MKYSLNIERQMETDASTLYQAWTENFDSWFAAPGTVRMKAVINEPFYFETHFEDQRHPHYGRFLKLQKDKLAELTWMTKGTKGAETILTVKLEPAGSGTHVTLSHKGFSDEESKNQHEMAWGFVLEQLDQKMQEKKSRQ
ncbi:SRPBCC domain-containing protein [Metabacillus sp. GX 13764]|uniref:SRPBCC family protein n=1 Tax=Metabacillus kandeliae TaxID=2900151 RepID=UPI001E57EE76|nr:SRPBCC domain-containing protein [Metabacillus kandeliae]MCD7035098.1 SRPBCC domain-containing protein [Metabacillus kandeliae]